MADNEGDKEVDINGKVFGENTKISFTLKTLAWAVGALLSVISTFATIGYFNVVSKQNTMQQNFEQEKVKYREDIKNMLDADMKDEVDKREILMQNVDELKGDIKLLLDRTNNISRPTQRNSEGSNTHNLPKIK